MFEWTADDLQILRLSLRVAAVATCASVPLAVVIALLLARGRFVGRGLLNA
jgi:molybdate transport system permease protein